MSTRPPQPPPSGPPATPDGPSPWRLFLKIALGIVAGAIVLFVVGVGLLAATCGGLFG